MSKKIKKRCECWSCQLSPKIKLFFQTLNDSQKKEFRKIFDEVWDHYESTSMDLDVLHSKIDGTWPNKENDNYYERIGNTLYLIQSTKIEEKNNHGKNKTT